MRRKVDLEVKMRKLTAQVAELRGEVRALQEILDKALTKPTPRLKTIDDIPFDDDIPF